jgi:predicted ATPase
MGRQIDKITLRGFKSLRDLESFPLRNLNILIGANGAGKSNFVSFFTFLRWAVEGRLVFYVTPKGGADGHLFLGPKVTRQVYAYLHFGLNGYDFGLEPTANNKFVFAYELGLFIISTIQVTRRLCDAPGPCGTTSICAPLRRTWLFSSTS